MAGSKSIIGLDIGPNSAKLVRAVRKNARVEVVQAEVLRIPADVRDRNEVIVPWLKAMNLGASPCVVGVAGNVVMFQSLILAPDDPRTPAQAVGIEMARFNEMAAEDMVYDFAPVSLQNDERRILISMARPAVLTDAMGSPSKAGLEVADLVPSPVAMFNALRSQVPVQSGPCCFVNIGHSATEVAVGASSGLMFVRAFPTAGSAFTEAVAAATGLPARGVDEFKVRNASLAGGEPALRDALVHVADTWLSDFDACMSVYRSTYPDNGDQPKRMILCGGGAELAGFTQHIKSRLNLDVTDASILTRTAVMKEPARFMTAIGLAMAGLGIVERKFSLLPPHIREELLFRRQKKYWFGAGLAATLILAIIVAGGYRDIRRQRHHLSEQQRILARCQKMADEIRIIEQANSQMLDMAWPVESLVRNGPFVRDLARFLATNKSDTDWISLICDPASYTERARHLEFKGGPDSCPLPKRVVAPGCVTAEDVQLNDFDAVIVEGYTAGSDLSSVRRLIDGLNAAPFIQRADLLSDDRVVLNRATELNQATTDCSRFVIEVVQAPARKMSTRGSAPTGVNETGTEPQ